MTKATFKDYVKRDMIKDVYATCGKSKGLFFEKFATETYNWSMVRAMYTRLTGKDAKGKNLK